MSPPQKSDVRYWYDVGRRTARTPPGALWRAHSDAVNTAWLAARLASAPVRRLLKTDLHDECVGDGLSPLLARHTGSLVGIDLATSAARTAARRDARLRTLAADVRALPFADGAFDVVVSNSTLDHFPIAADVGASLREIHRIVRPGGRLLLTLDNAANPLVALRNVLPFRALHALGLVPYQVGWTCRPRTLVRLVCEAGFEVLELGAILHCPRMPAVALASLAARYASARTGRRLLASLMRFERLEAWPTRFLTGYFTAIVARRPPGVAQAAVNP